MPPAVILNPVHTAKAVPVNGAAACGHCSGSSYPPATKPLQVRLAGLLLYTARLAKKALENEQGVAGESHQGVVAIKSLDSCSGANITTSAGNETGAPEAMMPSPTA